MTASETVVTHSPNTTWTDERVELLRSYAGAGLSCAKIAREIGVTRNAVIGKLNRLGLLGSRRAATGRPEHPGVPRLRRTRINIRRQILRAIYAETPPVTDDVLLASAARCSLLELAQGTCRWPISDPGARDFGFCGNGAVAGLPYCAGHARLAYRPARALRA